MLFVEAPTSRTQLAEIVEALGSLRPLVANMVEGGATPLASANELGEIGFRLVIFPGGIVRALARAARDYYASLAQHGSNAPFAARMFDFDALNAVIGTPAMLDLGRRYEQGGSTT